ncbi:MAG: exo-alpha-sialidase [Acidobacteria bacterium]|nr:exo-alpha-sialidase [Acidobacteriota bacterium]
MRCLKSWLLFLLVGTFALNCSQPKTKTAGKGQAAPLFEQQNLFSAGDHGYIRFRIPALVVSGKGTILAFAEARKGGGHDWDEIDLVLKRSFDHGKTWQEMQTLVDEGTQTMNQPCPVLDRETGTIWLPFCKNNQQVFVTKSTDDGASWSKPVEITSSVKAPSWNYLGSGPGHGIQLKSGRLLIPSWGDTSPGPVTWAPSPNWGKVQFSYAFYSDDHGATWKRGQPLDIDMSDECELVETSDGKVYMNMRSRQGKNYRAYAWSEDGGISWSKVQFDESLPEPSCQAGMVRFTSKPQFQKDRVLLSHPASRTDRSRLTLRLSYDEGHTWSVSKVVNEGRSAYSDLAVAADQTILCLYESDRAATITSRNALTLARLNLAWLTDGADSP